MAENIAWRILVGTITPIIPATAAVAGRFIARRRGVSAPGLAADDWLILASLVSGVEPQFSLSLCLSFTVIPNNPIKKIKKDCQLGPSRNTLLPSPRRPLRHPRRAPPRRHRHRLPKVLPRRPAALLSQRRPDKVLAALPLLPHLWRRPPLRRRPVGRLRPRRRLLCHLRHAVHCRLRARRVFLGQEPARRRNVHRRDAVFSLEWHLEYVAGCRRAVSSHAHVVVEGAVAVARKGLYRGLILAWRLVCFYLLSASLICLLGAD